MASEEAYRDILSALEKSRTEKEDEHHYLRNIVDHVGVGLVSFRDNGAVELYNRAAQRLFLLETLRNIDELAKVHPDLPSSMMRMRSGQQRLFKALIYGNMAVMSMKCTVFEVRGYEVKLISFQDIVHEMEGEEIESWQKLIKVLTHEIVNSITPLNTITSSIIRMLEKEIEADPYPSEAMLQSYQGLLAVRKRNHGLIDFINSYRNLTRIPKPVFAEVKIQPMFDELTMLMQTEMEQHGIRFTVENSSDGAVFQIDEKLISQVVINLLRNAVRAVRAVTDPIIGLRAMVDEAGGRIITVTDNGCGIPEDERDKIFVPFFTTSEDGSGIGLSISRQIMRLHKGSISVRSEEGEGSMFILRF